MAYVVCTRCGMTEFTVAYWSTVDYCGRCGEELPHPRRSVEPIARHSGFLAGAREPRAVQSDRADGATPTAA